MSNQKLILDLDDLAVESIEVVPASSLDSATYGHGTQELAASCRACGGDGMNSSCITCSD